MASLKSGIRKYKNIILIGLGIVSIAIPWLGLMFASTDQASLWLLVLYLSSAVYWINNVMGKRDAPIGYLGFTVANALNSLTAAFSFLYYSYGHHGNFSINLSRLDAIFFTIGTLTTAGTGNVVTMTEATRAIQTAQMVVDFAYGIFIIGIFASRISNTSEQI